jgi:hypothetical protein
MCFEHCGSTLDLPIFCRFSALWFFALLDHCVSSPCGSITAVPCWISFSALGLTFDLGSPSAPCDSVFCASFFCRVSALWFIDLWLDSRGTTPGGSAPHGPVIAGSSPGGSITVVHRLIV